MIDLAQVRSSDLWYIVGYIATDGNLSKDGRHIIITSKDTSHLNLIKRALFLKSKLSYKFGGYTQKSLYSLLQFSDVSFYRFLTSLGLTPNKSLTLGSLNIESDYLGDFLRGVIDGDGCTYNWIHKSNQHKQWSL